ncbi:hypothetical protein BCR43DRAFT_494721 [Syncephalastrum racemosum]|uniref:Uncharacterized protein n=1 Tax=Syncephalastrum racemosum TaxID=13706 RepID=A0A1X2H8G3_SYNRA|nr:hypothetical protein BCR43DRAFT_494721 [Syncephalastrum racemosum]
MGAKKASTETPTKRSSKSKQTKQTKATENEATTSVLPEWTGGPANDLQELSLLFEHIAQRQFQQREEHHHQLMDKLDTLLARLDKLGTGSVDTALQNDVVSITSTVPPAIVEPGTPKPAQSERATKKKSSTTTGKRSSSRVRKTKNEAPKNDEEKPDEKEEESTVGDIIAPEDENKTWADIMEEHDEQAKEHGHDHEQHLDHDADDVLTDYSHDKHNGYSEMIPHPYNAEGHTIAASTLKYEDIDHFLKNIMPGFDFEPARKELSRFIRSQCSPIAKHLAAEAQDNQLPTYAKLDEDHKQHLIKAAIPHAAALGLPTEQCADNWLIHHFVQTTWNSKARSHNKKNKLDDAASVAGTEV